MSTRTLTKLGTSPRSERFFLWRCLAAFFLLSEVLLRELREQHSITMCSCSRSRFRGYASGKEPSARTVNGQGCTLLEAL